MRDYLGVVPSLDIYRQAKQPADGQAEVKAQPEAGDEKPAPSRSQEEVEEVVLVQVLKYHPNVTYFAFAEETLRALVTSTCCRELIAFSSQAREVISVYNRLHPPKSGFDVPDQSTPPLPDWYIAPNLHQKDGLKDLPVSEPEPELEDRPEPPPAEPVPSIGELDASLNALLESSLAS